MENFESIVELLKKLHELTSDDMNFLDEYLKCTRKSFEKELETRTRQKKGKKDIVSALDSLERFEDVMKYLVCINPCNLESLISQAEELNSGIEITKLYGLTKQVYQQVESLLQQQAEATKVFNSKWTSMRKLTAKERRNEKVYALWKSGRTVTEIKEEVDKFLRSEGETQMISRQTIYNLIHNFKESESKND